MKKLNFLKNNKSIKNTLVLTIATSISQLCVVICSPFITRIYDTSDIGLYSYVITIASTFTAVLNCRYDMAIVVEDDDKNVYPLIKLSVVLGILFCILGTFLFGIYFLVWNKKYTQYGSIVIFFFIILFANNFINVFTAYNNRKKQYQIMAFVQIIRSFTQNLGALLGALFMPNVLGLIFPYTVGQLMGMKKQAYSLIGDIRKIVSVKWETVKHVAIKHRKFPLFSTPALLANSISYTSIVFFMEILFDLSIVGYYAISTRILGLPLALISGNVSKVYFREASEEYAAKGNFYVSFKQTFLLLLTISIPIGIIMYFVSPSACEFFFGVNWKISGEYIQILTPYFMLRFIGTAISSGLVISNNQGYELMIQILLVGSSCLAYIVTELLAESAITFLRLISLGNSLVYICLIFLVWRISKNND